MGTGEPTRWVCAVCGYVHEGPEPPETCPVCGVEAEQFEPVGAEAVEEGAADVFVVPSADAPPTPVNSLVVRRKPANTRWRCTICDYVHEGASPPDVCPVCGAPANAFVVEGAGAPGWHRALDKDELADDQAKTVRVAGQTLALVRIGGKYAAIDDACPHQGGPLGEGTVEEGRLRCPWHGWDFDPFTGKGLGGAASVATHGCEERDDGVYVQVESEAPGPRTFSDAIVETMLRWGVRHVFGMVGHSNLGMAEAMRRKEQEGALQFIGIRHEGAASFAASAYGKLTGKPAACLSIAGPGATNLLTGLWDAKVDRVPVLALTGQVDTQVLGPGAFQELDLSAAFASVAAFSQPVLCTSKPAELTTLALKHAVLRRDVAHLVLPNEVQTLAVDDEIHASGPEGRVASQEITPPSQAVEAALGMLRKASRPAIIVGHGARFRMPDVVALAERLRCPVITTFKGKGIIPDDHPLACGVLGRSGTPIASHFMSKADLLVVLGASFAVHTGIDPDTPTIQVDFDPMTLGKFHAVDVPVYGEIGITAKRLLGALRVGDDQWTDQRPEIAERWKRWRQEKDERAAADQGKGLSSAALFAAMSRQVPVDAVIAVDVGNNTYSFGRYFECQRQAILMSGYLGSIGFGYPAAMGAWAAAPDRPIWAVTGDGGFAQYMGELLTAVKYSMPIKHVLLNNHELGKITKEQLAANLDVWKTSLHNPSFASYAQVCGALGIRVESADELDEALGRAREHDGPVLVEVMTDSELV
ncbi:MAG: Rieske 2Fe-2S domain-containing protein [Deltaproteobacteria bacterium]|jgi:thiamine pyrophosphate-dependent acetolactate synthase large subunit-like protein/nitrite reductase/ring-hydroxylating ferredoxin subunit/rubredoxin|nr:Rieske 2Fe-2S domain-containing protein [Deltaproteobacteria bacterium]MBW2533018.1 Rieske 2Fe-2S domain-containing protein [Deltaproteobacteria bacterium]